MSDLHPTPKREVDQELKGKEWKSALTVAVAGLSAFLSLSGLSIYFLSFGRVNQFMVLAHTALGLLFFAPYIIYQIRHYLYSRQFNLSEVKLLGYSSLLVMAFCVVSGLVLTWQAAMTNRISYMWDQIHTISGLVFIPLIVAHILILA
ncbi:MAG: hypothetical protein V3T31_03510, partial [candidate division Zixibacteria bacterium]